MAHRGNRLAGSGSFLLHPPVGLTVAGARPNRRVAVAVMAEVPAAGHRPPRTLACLARLEAAGPPASEAPHA